MKITTTRDGGLLILPEKPEDIKYLENLKMCNPIISFFDLGKSHWMGGLKIECEGKEDKDEN